ncbi:MAG: hypothetical protein AAF471_05435 [Myxococcota bacterium]
MTTVVVATDRCKQCEAEKCRLYFFHRVSPLTTHIQPTSARVLPHEKRESRMLYSPLRGPQAALFAVFPRRP